MTQARAEDPATIYQVLVDDETFMDLIGTRIFEAGDTELDAISIVTPNAPMPKIKSVSGLEVIIHDVSEFGRRQFITNEVDITTVWKLFLLAWPPANGETMTNAAKRIMELFSKAVTIETAPTPTGLGSTVQLMVLIPSDSVIIDG